MSAHGDDEESDSDSGRDWAANTGESSQDDDEEEELEGENGEEQALPESDGLEELKQAMERHSGAPLYCNVCKVECNAQESFDKHMVGKKHEKEVKRLKAKGGKVEEKEEKEEKKPKEPKVYSKEDYENDYESDYWCDVCEIECSGEDSFKAHMAGVKHRKKLQSVECLKRIERSGEYYKYNPESGQYLCLTCDLEVTSPQVLEQHFKSNKHKETLQDCEPYFSKKNSRPANWSRYQYDQNSYRNRNSYQSGQNNGYYNRNSYHPDYRGVSYDYQDAYEDSWQEDGSFWCYICEVDCNSEESYYKHVEGKQHQKKTKENLALNRVTQSGEKFRKNKNGMFWCVKCKVEVSSAQILESHFKSNKHLLLAGMVPPEPKGSRRPEPLLRGSGFGRGGPGLRGPYLDEPQYGGGYERMGPWDRMGPRERMVPREFMNPRDRLGPMGRERYEDERTPLYTRQGAFSASCQSVLVTNLHPCVSGEDMEELFCTIGPIVSARKIREGVAEVAFLHDNDAYRSIEMFNGRPLDGQAMYVELMPDSSSTRDRLGPMSGMSARDRLGPMSGMSARDRLGPMSARDRLGLLNRMGY